ncbi:MAG: quinol:cytochrome C oxidoreductase [Schleiferiaceae bacterium]
MFEFSTKAKQLAIGLTVVGAILWVVGFAMNGSSSHEADHGHDAHATEMQADAGHDAHAEEAHDAHAEAHGAEAHDAHAEHENDYPGEAHASMIESTYESDHADAHGAEAHDAHAEHVHHQQQNRPWSALYVAAIFFLGLGLGQLFFLAIQYIAQAGWSAGLLRVMEAQAFTIIIPLIVIALITFLGLGHVHHMFHWMVEGINIEGHENYDEIIAGKRGFLNPTFFIIRVLVYIGGWVWAARMLRKNSLLSDSGDGVEMWKRNRKVGAIFTVFYAVTSSTSAWDLIMSIDTHWFSTLFGWYTFAGMFVSSFAATILVTLYLKSKGLLEWVNDNHIHDLGKFMFAFSVFWTYLWFSQFVLIWYANIPEEVTYYMQRWDQYKVPFFTMLSLNFIFPVLAILSRPAKRVPGTLVMAAVFVLVGHYMDHYVMIMPGTVGDQYGFGLVELGPILFFAGLFIYVMLSNLAKAPLLHKNHPMMVESKHFQQ